MQHAGAPPKKGAQGWYYGWVVVVACVASAVASGPGHSFGINEFVDHFIEDLHVSRTGISTAWLVASWVSAALVGLAGAALDHFGGRRLLGVICVPYVLVIFSLQFVHSLGALTVLVTCMRFLGPECLVLTATTTVNIWFVRKRGRAAALFSISKLFFHIEPMMFAAIIRLVGWRRAYRYLAPTCAALLAVAICFIRDSPEQFGLLPDGDVKEQEHGERGREGGGIELEAETDDLVARGGDPDRDRESGDIELKVEPDELIGRETGDVKLEVETDGLIGRREGRGAAGWDEGARGDKAAPAGGGARAGAGQVELEGADFRWALRRPIFWVLASSDVAEWMSWSALNYHISDLVHTQVGLGPTRTATLVYVPLALITSCISLLLGFLVIDRLSTRSRVQAQAVAKLCLSLVLQYVLAMRTEFSVVVFAAAWGLVTGSSNCIGAILHASIFGRRALGKIKGLATGLGLASSGLGVELFGLSRDYTGSYAAGIHGISLLIAAASVALLFVPVPLWTNAPAKDTIDLAPRPAVLGKTKRTREDYADSD
mmetsp:Transcript_26668/g.75319  ORF Transcript_26668/g.75319 Transcript_26668/m.75319 type:complete len:544 (-) Transcript_26668:48-1679(-)